MGYVPVGVTRFAGGTATATTTATKTRVVVPTQVMQDLMCRQTSGIPNAIYIQPTGGKPGYCARPPTTDPNAPTVTVTNTPATPERQTCGSRYGFQSEQAKACEAWLQSGGTLANFASAWACMQRGYTGQSLQICLDGRSKGASFAEIDSVIAQLSAQADAATQAQLAQEQALVASQKRKRLFIYGGIAVAAVVGFLIWKKRKGRKATAPKSTAAPKPAAAPKLTPA